MHKWLSIESAPKDGTYVIVALVYDGVAQRVSEARFNGVGWYNKGGNSCHWRTHWTSMPPLPAPPDDDKGDDA
jgi:hypothetical protein